MDAATRDRIIPSVIDVAGYVGVAAAIAGLMVALGDDASDEILTVAGLATTVVLLGAGWATERVRGVFWGLAVLAWAGSMKVLFTEVIGAPDGNWLVVVVAALTAVLSVPLWLVHRRSIQLIAVFVSTLVAVAAAVWTTQTVGVFGFTQDVPDPTWSALVTMVLGLGALWLGARSIVLPRRTLMVLGALALIAGALVVDLELGLGGVKASDLSLVAGLVASIVAVVVGNLTGERAPAGVGVAGVLVVAVVLVDRLVDETAAGWTVVVLGLVGMGVAAVLASRSRREPAEV